VRVLCRVDASVEIGSGHVFRCAALARRLADAGHVQFVCRNLAGDLNHLLETQGFDVRRLFSESEYGWTEDQDALACRAAVGAGHYDWVIVDHYGLGARWERAMAHTADRILAIDDLGRQHDCQVLLDQNYQSPVHDLYRSRLPADCERLLGPKYALLRPEFAALRAESLARPRQGISRVLVFMGGSDPLNETTKALTGIARLGQVRDMARLAVDVVIGAANPHRRAVETACADLPNATLHVQTSRMAQLMADADCAIGAPGSSTWERCTLGLPAVVTILAENQAPIGEAVNEAGGHLLLGWHDAVSAEDYARGLLALDAASLNAMSTAAAAICDGAGAERVAARLETRANRVSGVPRRLHA